MNVLDTVKSVLPWIGTALGGPFGAVAATAVGKVLGLDEATVDTVKATLSGMPPEELMKFKMAELEVQLKLQEFGVKSVFDLAELEVKATAEVNQTMRVEAGAEHWPTYSWRPFNGFLFGITIFCSYFLLPLFKIPVPTIPESVWLTWGGILGIASFFRGKAQADSTIPPAVQIPARHAVAEKIIGKLD